MKETELNYLVAASESISCNEALNLCKILFFHGSNEEIEWQLRRLRPEGKEWGMGTTVSLGREISC